MNRRIRRVGFVITSTFLLLFVTLNWLQIVDAKKLNNDPRNVRRIVRDYSEARGDIVTADGTVIATSVSTTGDLRRLRVYPYGSLFGNLTGYYSFQIGATGLENAQNSVLTGRDPELSYRDFGDLLTGKSHTGDVVLTLDARAQELARQALKGQQGSIVVVDTTTGAVVAMYQEPAFDPTVLSGHDLPAAKAEFDRLNLSKPNPALPRSFREVFPPGSTMKIVTTALALQYGKATPDTQYPALRELDLPLTDRTLKNFGGSSCGGTLVESFERSCNTTFGQIGLDLGEQLVSGMRAFGIGDNVPFDIGVARATLPAAGTFQRDQPQFAFAAIGQGQVATTPLQMALVAATIGNGGAMMEPYLVAEIRDARGAIVRTHAPEEFRRPITPEVAAVVRDMMVKVVEQGTGKAARVPGVQVAGKTGTAQTPSGGPPHAWFVGFAPANAPRYAIAVIVEDGGRAKDQGGEDATGGRIAAPIAKQVLGGLLGGQLPSPAPIHPLEATTGTTGSTGSTAPSGG